MLLVEDRKLFKNEPEAEPMNAERRVIKNKYSS